MHVAEHPGAMLSDLRASMADVVSSRRSSAGGTQMTGLGSSRPSVLSRQGSTQSVQSIQSAARSVSNSTDVRQSDDVL